MSTEQNGNGQPPEQLYQPDLDPEKVAYWKAKAQEVLDQHTRIFSTFTSEYKPLVALGDRRVRHWQASGYDIFLDEKDFPIESTENVILYLNYLGNVDH